MNANSKAETYDLGLNAYRGCQHEYMEADDLSVHALEPGRVLTSPQTTALTQSYFAQRNASQELVTFQISNSLVNTCGGLVGGSQLKS